MEELFFTDIMNWLVEIKANISYNSIEIDDKYYYTDSSSGMKAVYEMYKESKL